MQLRRGDHFPGSALVAKILGARIQHQGHELIFVGLFTVYHDLKSWAGSDLGFVQQDFDSLNPHRLACDHGDVYAVVFGGGDAWFAADPIDDVEEDDCGMGKCISDRITSVSMMRRGDVAWVTLRIATTETRTDSGRTFGPARHQLVIGCQLGAAPTCMTVAAGSHWGDGHAVILAHAVHVVDDDGARDLPIAF